MLPSLIGMLNPRQYAAAAMLAAAFCCTGCAEDEPKPDLDKALNLRNAAAGSAGGGAVAAGNPGRGWATLKGRFVYEGSPPSPGSFSPNNVPAGCGRVQFPDESLFVDAQSRGIKNVVVFLKKEVIGEDGEPRIHEEAPSLPTVFDQKNCLFTTHVMAVRTNTPIEFKNSDNFPHNTNAGYFNPSIGPLESFQEQFAKAESRPLAISCTIHPWMKAYILPRPDPYAAVTAEDGSFEIKFLPAETEITLSVWHERGQSGGKLSGSDDVLKNGQLKLMLKENETKEITINVPASAFR